MINLTSVCKEYNPRGVSVNALQHVDLRIADGEFSAVMGPSGSGKSTLLAIVGAMLPPSEGMVMIDGIDVYSLSHERQADFRHEYIGFVFQQLQLLTYLTAEENVLLPLAVARGSNREKRRRAESTLERVGLLDKADRLIGELSGGEQGRVAVARAIVNEPPLLLADEPTGSLDQVTGKQLLDMLTHLNEGEQTVVMVTHDEQAAGYSQRIIRILDGRISVAQEGSQSSHSAVLGPDAS